MLHLHRALLMLALDQTGGSPATKTSTTWLKDFTDRWSVLPGGFKLDAAQWAADAAGRKFVAAGTLVGRTKAERDAGAGLGPVTDALDEELYFTRYDVVDAATNADVEVVRPKSGVDIAENFLPAASIASLAIAGVRAKVLPLYNLIRGAD